MTSIRELELANLAAKCDKSIEEVKQSDCINRKSETNCLNI
jgi:hypothetical protein